jgi:protein-S-isoprenylcysteine O-methyltransferase Ste14
VTTLVARLKALSRFPLAWADAVPSRRGEQVWPAAARRRSDRLADFAGRGVIVVLFTLMTMRLLADFAETGRVTGLLMLVGEALVVALTVFRRAALVLDRSWRARIITGLSLSGPLFVRPVSDGEMASGAMTASLTAVGLLVVVVGKLSLGRSFGLMPANRGIVSSGVYRWLRHPIYAGYLLTHFGFLAAHATAWNVTVLLLADAALLARAVLEERTLALDQAYVTYQQRVRWRVLPGVF